MMGLHSNNVSIFSVHLLYTILQRPSSADTFVNKQAVLRKQHDIHAYTKKIKVGHAGMVMNLHGVNVWKSMLDINILHWFE